MKLLLNIRYTIITIAFIVTGATGCKKDYLVELVLTISRDSLDFSKEIIPRTTPAVPKLITSDEKEVQYYNTDGSSDEDSESERSAKGRHMSLVRSKAPPMGVVVLTSDLFKSFNSNQGLKLTLPGLSTSFRSSQGSFGEDDNIRSIAIRPKSPAEFGSSPSQPGRCARDRSE